MVWALSAPVSDPMSRVILINLANYAGEAGRGAWPSQATLLERAQCSRASLNRKLGHLEAEGLIRRGDQELLSHLPLNRRPVVWDLNLAGAPWGLTVRPQDCDPETVDNPPETVDNTVDEPVDSTEVGVSPRNVWGLTAETQTVIEPKEPLTPSSSVGAVLAGGCPEHQTTALHCRACGTAPRGRGTAPRDRSAADRRAAATARRRIIEACLECDPVGWVETPRGAVRCSHNGVAEVSR